MDCYTCRYATDDDLVEVEEYNYFRCPNCKALVFVYFRTDDLDYFKPTVNDEQVQLVISAYGDGSAYRLAQIPLDEEVRWPIYVTSAGEVRAFKDSKKPWDLLIPGKYGSKGDRAQVSIERRTTFPGSNKPQKYQPTVSRLVQFAWGDLAQCPYALVMHKDDLRSDDSIVNTNIGDGSKNARTFREQFSKGKLSKTDVVQYPIPRGVIEGFRKVSQLKGAALEKYIAHVLVQHLQSFGS